MNVNKRLNVNYRAGFRVNVLDVLQDLENKYRTNLNTTVEVFTTYDEVSNETINDNQIFIAELDLMRKLGYINEDEFEAMVPIADEIRMNILEKLEKEGANNGSEKEQ